MSISWISEEVEVFNKEIKILDDDKGMKSFVETNMEILKEINQNKDIMVKSYTKALRHFGLEEKTPVDIFFGYLDNFITSFEV